MAMTQRTITQSIFWSCGRWYNSSSPFLGWGLDRGGVENEKLLAPLGYRRPVSLGHLP